MTAKLLFGNEAFQYQNWNTVPDRLKSEQLKIVYIGPNGLRWDLAGPYALEGRQGVILSTEMQGFYHLPFEQLFTEGAYQVGATYERTNVNKRVMHMGVTIGSNTRPLTTQQYRMVESNWWDSWPPDQPGWLGVHSRFGGWRWAQVQLAKPVDTSMKRSPSYAKNNTMTWDMQLVAPKPWYAKRTLMTKWVAHPHTVGALTYDEETIHIANRGNLSVWPKYLYSGPGRATIQDGMTNNMVQLPVLSADDGYVLVDTDPSQRMLTGSKDPVDNIFYQYIRASKILDFFLHDIEALGLPVWRRAAGIRFISQIPARTVASIKVRHDHPNGVVIVLMPQRFTRPS